MAEDTKSTKENPLQQLVGGILGVPTKVLKETGLDKLGTMVVDSMQPDGTISVSHLLDLGGIRTARQKRRELSAKYDDLRTKEIELQLEEAKSQDALSKINEALGLGSGQITQPEVLATPQPQQAQPALQAPAAPQAPALPQAQAPAPVEAPQESPTALLRNQLNEALRARGVSAPEGLTQHIPIEDMSQFDVEVSRRRIEAEQAARNVRVAQEKQLTAAKVEGAKKVYQPAAPGTSFDKGVSNDLEVALGVKSVGANGKVKTNRLPSRSDLATINAAKGVARNVLTATKDKAAANAAGYITAKFASGRPRFDLAGDAGYAFEDTWTAPLGGGNRLAQKDLASLVRTISEHRARNDVLLRSKVGGTVVGAPMGIDPRSQEWVQEWARALADVPGLAVSLIPDPANPQTAILAVDENAPGSLPPDQIRAILRAIEG